MDPLEFFLRKKMYYNRQHNRRNNEQEGTSGLKNQKVHSSVVAAAWMEAIQLTLHYH